MSHGSSISILSLFSSFCLFVFVVVSSTPTLNIKIKSQSLKSVHWLITEWVTRSPNELNILSLVQLFPSLVEKHLLTINTAICDTSLQYQGSLDWWICHITICCFKWHILEARFNIRKKSFGKKLLTASFCSLKHTNLMTDDERYSSYKVSNRNYKRSYQIQSNT